MSVEDEVLKRIVPSEDENRQISEVIETAMDKIKKLADSLNLDLTPVMVGSVAKKTHLTNPDIDIFIMFPDSTKRQDLEALGLKIGKGVLEKHEIRYAEHPYVGGTLLGFKVEIVPCYKIENPSQRMTAVDRTPFHTDYVIKHLKDEQKNEVRLLKQFLKGIGIYGAEAEVEGFSGYLCELLILHGGTFGNLAKKASEWKSQEIIEFDKQKHAEFKESLVVIDPVDPKRNVASALSKENYATFIYACNEFKRNPKLEFFFPNRVKPKPLSTLKDIMNQRGTNILGIVLDKPDVLSDILHSQLRKAQKAIEKLCERFGFSLIASDFFVGDEITMLFEFDIFSLPSVKLHRGPPVWHENARDFKNKWIGSKDLLKGPFIKDGHWYVDTVREFTDAKTLIEKNLVAMNLGGHVSGSIKNGYRLLEGEDMLKEDFSHALTKFYSKRFPWEY